LGGVGGGVVIEEVEQFGKKAGLGGGGRAVAHAGQDIVDVGIFSQRVQEVEGVRQEVLGHGTQARGGVEAVG
jgi:hypothetical protein